MLNQYKNINQIRNRTKSVNGERISSNKSSFVSIDTTTGVYFNNDITLQSKNQCVELHVHSDNSWITANYKVTPQQKIPEYRDKSTNTLINLNKPLAINLYSELDSLNLTPETYDITINFFKNLIGSYAKQHLRVEEISPDHTEIKLRAIDAKDPEFLQQITNFIKRPRQTSTKFYKTHLLNFNRNNCILFVNSVVIGEYLYVKLHDPLPADIEVDFKCWVVEEQKAPYIDRVTINIQEEKKTFNKLANPNWQANYSYNTSTETGLKTWTELLGSSVQTSQEIVDTFFSGSLSGIKLNIDYTDFNNFIFYSSATERLANFRYKLQLIEHYNSSSIYLQGISGSIATTNITDNTTATNKLIGGFDDFEKFLYYQSSSKLTTHRIPLENPNVLEITGSYIQPSPKSTTTYPYTLYPVTSSQFTTWYNNVYTSASLYDINNLNSLLYTVPEYVRTDSTNIGLNTFVNMLGHHYDILYTYINNMSKIHDREENPKLGMPNELLYSVAKQFGWNLTDGRQDQDLWQYVLGTNESGIPVTGSNSIGDPGVSGQNITYSIWRRIVNNLPLLLKTKGTKRSIQALLSCYGIPQSMISINEYGGPRSARIPVYEKLNFDYSLDLITNTAGTVTTDFKETINTIELRFRTDDVVKTPTLPSTMNLFTIGDNVVTLDFTRGTLGTVQINNTSSADIELFDGGYLTAMLRNTGTNLELVTKKSKYGKIIAEVSCSAVASFPSTGSVIIGGTVSGSRLQGQVQELRLWNNSLNDSAFNNHVKAPAAYDGNIDAYDELIYRLPLTQKINHSLTSSLSGVQPKSSTISSSFASWTNDTPYDSIEETYYYDGISIGAGTFDDNKIRIEDNELIGDLNIKTRAERSQFDKAPLDSKKLGVYFSPQTMIDEDIIAQLGFTDLDQYIGDPGDTEDKSYPDLIRIARNYWKKYEQSNDINSYIKIFTLFDLSFFKQLEQLLPARADVISGILIKPNILERNKDKVLPNISYEDVAYNTILEGLTPSSSAKYLVYEGETETRICTISGFDDDQYQGFLTASVEDRYGGTTYSHQYVIRSGSQWINATSPFWLSEAVSPIFSASRVSEFKQLREIINGVETFKPAEISDFLPTGINNQKYAGSKMTSADFNVDSPDTIDGKPVVEFLAANPNQFIVSQGGTQGSFIIP